MDKLSLVQSELLAVLEAFMHDKVYQVPEGFSDVQQLFKLAYEHKILAVTYEQIRANDIWEKEEYRNMLPMYKKHAVKEIMLQMQRTEGFLHVYEQLKDKGLTPLVVKGMVCRNLYSKSDYRTSGDEDVLLPREQFKLCDEILVKNGFTRSISEEKDVEDLPYEIPYINPKNGVYIELHFSLFPEEAGAYGHLSNEFSNVYENMIEENIRGKGVWTMCPTDHIFYLICHSFKHFLHSGFGVRQVADMIMMAEHYGNAIDWETIEEKLERLNMKKYWEALARMGVKYLGFSLEKAAYPIRLYDTNAEYQALLKDILDSGIYGGSSMERKHSSNMTLAAAATGKASTSASIKSSLFPKESYMKTQYVWLEKYPCLLPIAYILRIVRYLKKRKQSVKQLEEGQNSIQIGIDRVELLKKYEIIE